MGYGETDLKLTKEQEKKLTTWFDEFWSVLPSGQGAKVARGKALEAWYRQFKKTSESEWLELFGIIKEAMVRQENHRRRLFKEYPDERSRKQANIFIPTRPHPATWINQHRWHDEVLEIKEKTSTPTAMCVERNCPKDGKHFVKEGMVCDWHWTKRHDTKGLSRLYDVLRSKGLELRPDETKEQWSQRCREHVLNGKWGKTFRNAGNDDSGLQARRSEEKGTDSLAEEIQNQEVSVELDEEVYA